MATLYLFTMHVKVEVLDIEGLRKETHGFYGVVTASHYRSDDDGYSERVVVEHETEDGDIVSDTITSEYGARIIHVEE